MIRIVYFGIPAYGHVNPALPVLRELSRRGHVVTAYNTEDFRPHFERAGTAFHPYPTTGMTPETITASLQQGQIVRFLALLLRTTEVLLPWIETELARQQPDLVAFDSTTVWGPIACAPHGLPSASLVAHFLPAQTLKELRMPGAIPRILRLLPLIPAFALSYVRLARRCGRFSLSTRRGLHIVFSSRELQPNAAPIDSSFRFVGPSLNPSTRRRDSAVAVPVGQPVAYISLGTIHGARPDFYSACFDAFGQYPARFILTATRGGNTNGH